MFNYSSNETVLPSLVFTKAELVYALSVLMSNIPCNDNTTKIEMVELRHYLTMIKDKVAIAAADGTLKGGLRASCPAAESKTLSPPPSPPQEIPSMDELRLKFPSLSDGEIQEVLIKVKSERDESAKQKKQIENQAVPTPPSFIAHQIDIETPAESQIPLTKKQIANRLNSKKFANLLGAV